MLYITSNIPDDIPQIEQKTFEEIINDAINSEYPLENVWRIALQYNDHNLNYDIIDKFFIETGNPYYLSEYICIIPETTQEKIVNMLIEKNDKELIREFLFRYVDGSNLDLKNVEKLREFLSKETQNIIVYEINEKKQEITTS